MRPTARGALALVALCAPSVVCGQGEGGARRPLGPGEIDAVARLTMLEDSRVFDAPELTRLLAASHPEVRRRASITVGRLADRRGVALLLARPLDADTAVAAATVFAVGQLRDTSTIAWLDSLLATPRTPPTVAAEAAAALGKIKTAPARAVLARFLSTAAASPRTAAAVGEALLAVGRSTARGDIAPVVRWARSPSEELRWRATWALFRPRDPAAVPTLLTLSADPSALVRSWAVRGLTKPQADSAALPAAETRLLAATRDVDRRVRTEAIRALGTYTDPAAVAALGEALGSPDSWIAVSAAEGLGRVQSAATVPRLLAAAAAGRPCALRVTAMQALQAFAPADANAAAVAIARDRVPYCRTVGLQALARAAADGPLGAAARAAIEAALDDTVATVRAQARQARWAARDAGLDLNARRASRREDLAASDVAVRAAALRTMAAWADTTDLPVLFAQYDRARADSSPAAASAAAVAIAGVQRRHGAGAAVFFTRFRAPDDVRLRREVERAFAASVAPGARGGARPPAWPAAPHAPRPLADYRRIVERWVVPDYEGRPRPRARWETTRGAIELELYAGDAPLAVDDFARTTESGAIVGTEFIRVVPDFVDQQRAIADGNVLRDEVNRHRLTRGNLSWASAGLDTGSPGYTLGHTPQPHNEGDFTALGRVVRGMDVVDRVELGDRVVGARMLTGGVR